MTKNASCEELNQVKEVETLAKEGESPVNLFGVFIDRQCEYYLKHRSTAF